MRYKKLLGLFVIIFGIILILPVIMAEELIPISATCTPVALTSCSRSIDNNIGTEWSIDATSGSTLFPQRAAFDLGEVKNLKGIKIYIMGTWASGSPVQVESSNDRTTWNLITDITLPGSLLAGWQTINFPTPVSTQYIRVSFYGYHSSYKKFNKIYEFRAIVDDEPGGLSCTGEFSYTRPNSVYCSTVWKNNNYYSCLNILGIETRWWLSDTTPTDEWVYGDLGEEKCISNVRVFIKCPVAVVSNCNAWMPMTVDIQTTNNPSDEDSWTTVVNDWSLNQGNDWIESPDFNSNARYVRLYLKSSAIGMVLSRYEINTANAGSCVPEDISVTCGSALCGEKVNNCGVTVSCDVCDDSLFCNGVETCVSGSCNPGIPVNCDEPKTCTINEVCNEDSDSCTYTRDHTVCDDYDDCTVDNCDPINSDADPITGCVNVIDTECVTNTALWTNMKGIIIDSSNLKDRVKLVVTGSNFLGKNVEYKIIKKGFIFLLDTTIHTESSNSGFITWKAGKISEDNFESGNYIFIATVEGVSVESGNLVVLTNEENTAPVADITSPDTGDIYLKGTNVEFRQNSFDPDDFFDYTWNIDGETRTGSSRDNVNYEFDYSYNSAGQKRILLNVVDERSLSDSDNEDILIIDPGIDPSVITKYVFSGIKEPVYNSFVNNPVEMDGSNSFAIEVRGGVPPVITCIAGKCPCSATGHGGDIPIIDCLLPVDYSDLIFNWKFDSGNSGKATVAGLTKYLKTFATLGWHDAELKVNLLTGEESVSNTRFRITNVPAGESGCLADDKTKYKEFDTATGITTIFDTMQPNNKCKGFDDTQSTADDCCPTGYICELDGTAFKCQASLLDINKCEDYTVLGEGQCENDPFDIGKTGPGGETCGKYINEICGASSSGVKPEDKCECYWTGTECRQRGRINIEINNIEIGDLTCELQSSDIGDCIDSVMTITETSGLDWTNIGDIANKLKDLGKITATNEAQTWLEGNCNFANTCSSGTRYILCGAGTSKRLDFFSYWNFIIAFIMIGVVYILININFRKDF